VGLAGRRASVTSDSPGLMVSLRAAGACVRAPPLPPKRASALGLAPTMTPGRARNGRLLAGMRPRPSRAPHRSPGVRPRWAGLCPLLQRGSDSLEDTNTANPTTLANGVKNTEFTDVKDSEKRADKPPKLRGAPRAFGGEDPPAPDNYGGQPGGLLARPTGGPMKGSSPEAHVR